MTVPQYDSHACADCGREFATGDLRDDHFMSPACPGGPSDSDFLQHVEQHSQLPAQVTPVRLQALAGLIFQDGGEWGLTSLGELELEDLWSLNQS